MTKALLKGADGANKRERGRRLQPDTLKILTQPGATPGYTTHIAAARSGQAKNRFPVCLGTDGSTLIRNQGQLCKVLMALRTLVSTEYGRQGCSDPHAAQALFLAYAAVEDAAAADDNRYVRTLDRWAPRRLPGLGKDARAAALAELRTHPVEITSRFLGELLGLTDAQRDRCGFWLAEPVDLSPEAKAEKLRAKDRERKEQKRRKAGVRPKGETLALARQLYPEAPRSTLFRRARELNGGSNA